MTQPNGERPLPPTEDLLLPRATKEPPNSATPFREMTTPGKVLTIVFGLVIGLVILMVLAIAAGFAYKGILAAWT
jgi:tetrahydromethanopterin S-methyltransferase subunit B